MQMRRLHMRYWALPVALGALVGACDGGESAQLAPLTLSMQRSDIPIASATAGDDGATSNGGSVFGASDIATLTVTITSIDALPHGSLDDERAWVSIALNAPVTLDLLALPVEGESPLVIASGLAQVGAYEGVRLFVSSAQIEFANDLALGGATYEAGVAYDVIIPSGAQTGVKTDVAFEIVLDDTDTPTEVHLLFVEGATFANATITGSGDVMLAPVIKGVARAQ